MPQGGAGESGVSMPDVDETLPPGEARNIGSVAGGARLAEDSVGDSRRRETDDVHFVPGEPRPFRMRGMEQVLVSDAELPGETARA